MIGEESKMVEDNLSINAIEQAFQDIIKRIQQKIKKYEHLKTVMDDFNQLRAMLEKGQDGEYKTRRGNNRIQKGDSKHYECRICKKKYQKSQQLGGHLRKGHPKKQGQEFDQP